jgi:hypothetical protein
LEAKKKIRLKIQISENEIHLMLYGCNEI